VRHSNPVAEPSPAGEPLCGNDVTNLIGTIGTMPPSVQAQVVGMMSPDLANGLGAVVLAGADKPPPPDAATLAGIMTRLTPQDRSAVMSGLSAEQQTAVAGAEETVAVGSYASGIYTACS
jgi:hypothetical protein